jgi:glycosyltransferase involved in cell wall biosynthesis
MISVIISTYHQNEYLAETIQSVLDQTYKNFELIIIDDNDNNFAKEIYLPYVVKDNRIFYIKTEDKGLSYTRNLGGFTSSGEFLLYLDGDDKIHPQFLEKTVKILEEDKKLGFVYTDTQHFDESNGFWEQPEYNFHNLLLQNYICSCSLIRRSAFLSVNGFDKNNFNYWEDWQFWISLGSKGWYGKHLSEKLFYYRVHHSQGMQSERNTKLGLLYRAYIISKFPELYDIEWGSQANNILGQYPKDIMQWKPKEQEDWLKEK